MTRVYLAGPSCSGRKLERAQALLTALAYDVHVSGSGLGLSTELESASDCVDSAAADLNALLAADVVAVCARASPEPWEVEVARSLGIPVVPVLHLLAVSIAS